LDFDELFQLALRAMQSDDDEKAISLLKRALDLKPNNAKARYLLGAMHAQIGLYDRAVDDLAQAVAMDPSLDAAHFQLGLLHLTSGRVAEAEAVWKALDKLPADHYMLLFKLGMVALARDEFARCVELLEKGIAANQQNASLNRDMQRVIDKAKPLVEQNNVVPLHAAADTNKEKTTGRKVILSAYQNDNDEIKH
jgi:tetratricopeptide (TPR) repeat protein